MHAYHEYKIQRNQYTSQHIAVASHPFFGTSVVVETLKKSPTYRYGYADVHMTTIDKEIDGYKCEVDTSTDVTTMSGGIESFEYGGTNTDCFLGRFIRDSKTGLVSDIKW